MPGNRVRSPIKIKFVAILVIAMVLVAGASLILFNTGSDDEPRYAIFATNDIHSYVEGFKNATGVDVGGLDRISSCVKTLEEHYSDSLLVSSGDDVAGNFFNTFQGIPETSTMSLIGYDVATPGNHEFDYGLDMYRTTLSGVDYDIVSSNLMFDDIVVNSSIDVCCIKTLGGIDVGFFGLITPSLPAIVKLDTRVTVDDGLINISKLMVAQLEEDGADMVVLLSHCGADLDRVIAANVSGIDLIVGGHDHISYHQIIDGPEGWSTHIVQGGCYGEHLGVLSFQFDGQLEDVEWELVPMTEEVGSDSTVVDHLWPYIAEYDQLDGQAIGVTDVPLDARHISIRRGETNLGDLVADAVLDKFSNVPIALFNSGSIGGDIIYPAGNISLRTVHAMLPYASTIYLVNMTGAQIKQVLEISAASNRSSGDDWPGNRIDEAAFLQVSGLRYSIDTSATPFCAVYDGRSVEQVIYQGERVCQVEVFVEGAWVDLDINETYTVATNDYLQAGGDGYYVFNEIAAELKVFTSEAMVDVLADYIRTHTPISLTEGQRIIVY